MSRNPKRRAINGMSRKQALRIVLNKERDKLTPDQIKKKISIAAYGKGETFKKEK